MKLNRQKEHSSATCFALISAACHNYHKAIKNISEPLPEPLIASCGLFRCKNPVKKSHEGCLLPIIVIVFQGAKNQKKACVRGNKTPTPYL